MPFLDDCLASAQAKIDVTPVIPSRILQLTFLTVML